MFYFEKPNIRIACFGFAHYTEFPFYFLLQRFCIYIPPPNKQAM